MRSRWGWCGHRKTLLLYYEHHFDEYRKFNIKNPLFTLMADFLCWGRIWCGARDGSTAIPPSWRQKSLQYIKGGHIASRKQQSNSLYFAVNPPPFDKEGKGVGNFRGIVRKRRSRWGNVGAVKALLLYCRTPFWRVLRIEYKESAVYCKWRIFVLENFVGEGLAPPETSLQLSKTS